MRLILIRHGRPDEDDIQSPHDPPLNADGVRQAQCVASLLCAEGVTRIVSSPMKRARQTAEPLARELSADIEIVDGWAEADRSATKYRSTETLRAEGGDAWARFLADPIGYLGGDTATFRAGVIASLHKTTENEDRNARVAVFTHGLPINISLSHALGLETITNFLVGYGSVSRLRRRPDGAFGVSSVNETAHQRGIINFKDQR
jgi:broad specificity phosphatase PhoE